MFFSFFYILLHFSVAFHDSIAKFSDVFFTMIFLKKPGVLSVSMEFAFFEPSFIEHTSRLMPEFTAELNLI